MLEPSARARHVLYHCVTEYVATGEPVGSRTLAKKSGLDLSPASIRNVLADLEDAGYLRQPHTSAGRVPTDRAFRLFIDALMQVRALTNDDAASIRDRFASLEPAVTHANVMRETGRLLSELTGTAAVVVARAEMLVLKQLRFLRTGPEEVLAVLVMKNGTVQNRFLRVAVSEADLRSVHNLLDDVVEGRTLGDLRDLFERRLQSEHVQHDELRRRAFELGGAAVEEAFGGEADLFIEGQEKLLEKPEFDDVEHVRQLLTALDARKKLVRLLDLAIRDKGGQVVVGEEVGDLGGGQLSIVGASYTAHGQAAGTVGVIGPTRMDYPRVLPLVEATAKAMSNFMDRSEGGKEAGSISLDEAEARAADSTSTLPRRPRRLRDPDAT